MTPKRVFLPILILLLFLGGYTWNLRTGHLDDASLHAGLEGGNAVLRVVNTLHSRLTTAWSRYVDLVGVREENQQLKEEITRLRTKLQATREDNAELARLREQLQIDHPDDWQALGCRVLGRRIGPNSPLLSLTLGRGYLSGALPQTPVMTPMGVAGIVLRSGPYTSTALLITDPGVRISVLTQQSRIHGILTGTGAFNPLKLHFIPSNSAVEKDEMLITSGMDKHFPKGLPVAQITSVAATGSGAFMDIDAKPLPDLTRLEEVTLIVRDVPQPQTPVAPKTAPSSKKSQTRQSGQK